MNSKIFVLAVAVAAVGLFAMPNSLTLFAGQHTFDNGTNVRCEKCHQDIYDELSGTNARYGISTAHSSIPELQRCEGCHRVGNLSNVPLGKLDNGSKFYGDFNRTNLSGAHAAVTMECVGCHTNVPNELLNVSEAHSPFYNESRANGSTILMGANIACVGCHTHSNVTASWRRSIGYDMIVNETIDGNYSITFTVNRSVNTTHTTGGNVTADIP